MTIEKRGTIQMGDVVAVEFECKSCHLRTIRPLTDEIVIPGRCGAIGCSGTIWFADGSGEHQDLQLLLRLLSRLRNWSTDRPFALKLEISGLGAEK